MKFVSYDGADDGEYNGVGFVAVSEIFEMHDAIYFGMDPYFMCISFEESSIRYEKNLNIHQSRISIYKSLVSKHRHSLIEFQLQLPRKIFNLLVLYKYEEKFALHFPVATNCKC